MNIKLIKRNNVFVPCYDEDYDTAKKLKENTPYIANVKFLRNADLNKKYHTLIDRAWNCLNEKQTAFFGANGKEAFRKSMEITAGFFEPVFSFDTKTWHQMPKSTSFDSMEEDEFEMLYSGVYDCIRTLLTNKSMSEAEFDAAFDGF